MSQSKVTLPWHLISIPLVADLNLIPNDLSLEHLGTVRFRRTTGRNHEVVFLPDGVKLLKEAHVPEIKITRNRHKNIVAIDFTDRLWVQNHGLFIKMMDGAKGVSSRVHTGLNPTDSGSSGTLVCGTIQLWVAITESLEKGVIHLK